MSIVYGPKIGTWVSAADGDTYGDAQRFFLRGMQAVVQANVINMTLTSAPALTSGNNGNTYVMAGIGGGWSGGAINDIAYWAVDPQDDQTITANVKTGAWEFYAPKAGWQVYDNNTGLIWQFNGVSWTNHISTNTDVAGTITIIAGATSASFSFALPYASAPVVNVTPTSSEANNIGAYWVTSSTTGFTVNCQTAPTSSPAETITFNYAILGNPS